MKLISLENDNKDLNNLYDLTVENFIPNYSANLKPYLVTKEDNMRIDLVCNNIYGNCNYCDYLLYINGIDNPLNILEGDIFYFVDLGDIDIFKKENVEKTKEEIYLINTNKKTKIDSSRKDFIENDYSLPPNFNLIPKAPAKIEGNKIILGN